MVAIYNMSNGIDIWDIGKAERRQSCKMPRTTRQNFPLPVTFLHNRTAVAAGHMEGRVNVWNVKDGSFVEELGHSGWSFLYYNNHKFQSSISFCDSGSVNHC